MTRGVGGHSPSNVMAHLRGAHFPALKPDILSTARSNGAPSDVMDVLERLPEQEYGGPQDVMKAYGRNP